MTDFEDIVETEGLTAQEEARLRRVHDLLVEAGPPADLPPHLSRPGEPPTAEIVQFPLLPRRRFVAALVAAAAVAAAVFGGGYLLGHSKAPSSSLAATSVVSMRPPGGGSSAGLADLKLAKRDSVGNWPMQIEVTGLPKQRARSAYYELWLTSHGRPTAPCGTFRVNGDTTSVRFTVPYQLTNFDGWVVTTQGPGAPDPGRVVLTT